MDEHPGVHFVDGALGRRPAVLGTGLDVWEVIETVLANDRSAEAAADYLEIEPRLVQVAVGYYGSNRDEIDSWIERVHEIAEEEEGKWRRAREALSGGAPRADLLRSQRERLLAAGAERGARNVRVFGSVSRREEDPGSDVDLLVDLDVGRTLVDLAAFRREAGEVLGVSVDVVTTDMLKDRVREAVLAEAAPL